jgi:flagellar basal-body rod protein FlgC
VSLFDALHTSGSGLFVYRKWLDAVSDNLANINTVRRTDQEAFRPRFVVAEAATGPTGEGAGARVAGVVEGAPEGRVVHEPDNPLADAQGNVRYPDIDLGAQMTHLMLAQRGYQANPAVSNGSSVPAGVGRSTSRP